MFKRGSVTPKRKIYVIVYDNEDSDKLAVYEALERPSQKTIADLLGIPKWKVWEINEVNEIRRLN